MIATDFASALAAGQKWSPSRWTGQSAYGTGAHEFNRVSANPQGGFMGQLTPHYYAQGHDGGPGGGLGAVGALGWTSFRGTHIENQNYVTDFLSRMNTIQDALDDWLGRGASASAIQSLQETAQSIRDRLTDLRQIVDAEDYGTHGAFWDSRPTVGDVNDQLKAMKFDVDNLWNAVMQAREQASRDPSQASSAFQDAAAEQAHSEEQSHAAEQKRAAEKSAPLCEKLGIPCSETVTTWIKWGTVALAIGAAVYMIGPAVRAASRAKARSLEHVDAKPTTRAKEP